jgi:hypothetical protein
MSINPEHNKTLLRGRVYASHYLGVSFEWGGYLVFSEIRASLDNLPAYYQCGNNTSSWCHYYQKLVHYSRHFPCVEVCQHACICSNLPNLIFKQQPKHKTTVSGLLLSFRPAAAAAAVAAAPPPAAAVSTVTHLPGALSPRPSGTGRKVQICWNVFLQPPPLHQSLDRLR